MSATSGALSFTPFTPRAYQSLGAQWLVDHPRGMLVADPGLGKTATTLLALEILRLTGSQFFPALILAPKRVADVVWTTEAQKWDAFQDMSIVKVMGDADTRSNALKSLTADLYVINYDLAPWLVSQWSSSEWPFKIVVADESSRLKGFRLSKGGVRSAALSNIARFTGRWWNLTGTPIPNGIQDLWGQMWFLDFGERLKHSYTAFSEAYLMEDRYTRRVRPQMGAESMIHEKTKDLLVSFRAEDWLDIQKPQMIPMPFRLPPEAMRRYQEMEKDFFLEIDGTTVSAGTAMVKSTKLLQILGGSVYDGDSQPHAIHGARLEVLDDVLEQIAPAPLLVSYWWRTDPPRILEHLARQKIPARVYQGPKDEVDWNRRKFRVLLLQEQSAFGLNLHEPCRDLLHYTYWWSGELWEQMIGRIGPTRQAQAGKKAVVRVWYAQAVDTIEAAVIDSNLRKISTQDALKRARARRL